MIRDTKLLLHDTYDFISHITRIVQIANVKLTNNK